ncbi:MAG TPA: hypothetical protein DDW68_05620 [Verrucomicrobiales bacterium]|nr:hypothetical protein [Verrucomicrobiales bacterium]
MQDEHGGGRILISWLDPIAGDEFVSLGQGMDAIPDLLLGRSDFGGGVKNFLSLDMNRVVVFRERGDDRGEVSSLREWICRNPAFPKC